MLLLVWLLERLSRYFFAPFVVLGVLMIMTSLACFVFAWTGNVRIKAFAQIGILATSFSAVLGALSLLVALALELLAHSPLDPVWHNLGLIVPGSAVGGLFGLAAGAAMLRLHEEGEANRGLHPRRGLLYAAVGLGISVLLAALDAGLDSIFLSNLSYFAPVGNNFGLVVALAADAAFMLIACLICTLLFGLLGASPGRAAVYTRISRRVAGQIGVGLLPLSALGFALVALARSVP